MASKLEAAQELEWRKCAEDKAYFFEHYYYIPVVGVGATLYHPRDYQIDLHKIIDENTLINGLKARQIGYTTASVAEAVHDLLFKPEHPWLFISRGEDAAIKMLGKALYGFNRLPSWMHDRIGKPTSLTQSTLALENGSRIESIPTTAATGRGDSVYGVVIDEAAFIDNAGAVWAAIEPLVYGKALLVSTANGMGNFFHDIWLDSQRSDSAWTPVFYPWHVVPERDEAWYEQKKRAHRGQEWYFYQEYPATADEAFVKSGRVAFGADVLEYNDFCEPDLVYAWTEDGVWTLQEEAINDDITVDIWRLPEVEKDEDGAVVRKPNYVVAADVAEGLDHGDWTVVKVFDVTSGEEVASSRSHIPAESLGFLLEQLGYYYHTALILVESNNHGAVPITYLKKARYPRIYRSKPSDRRRAQRSERYGFMTTIATKPKMVVDLLQALRDEDVLFHDEQFKLEAMVFTSTGKGSYAAKPPNHDDTIMATCLAMQGILDVGRFPIVWREDSDGRVTFNDVFNASKKQGNKHFLEAPIGSTEGTRFKPTIML